MLNDAGGPEDLAIFVEALESGFDSLKTLGIMDIAADKIAEFNEVTHSADHLRRDMPLNSRQVHFHKCLRIVASPLLEPSPIRKAA